jgi:hypothetical protein
VQQDATIQYPMNIKTPTPKIDAPKMSLKKSNKDFPENDSNHVHNISVFSVDSLPRKTCVDIIFKK